MAVHTNLTDADIGITVAAQGSGGSLPAGLICMWGGLIVNIPSGWLLCDGLNGTPDLRSKFVKGSAAGVDPGVTGGAASASYTPQGTSSTPTFTGTGATPTGTVAAPTFTGTSAQVTSATSAGTPAGTNSAPAFTGTSITDTTKVGSGTTSVAILASPKTPAGTVAAPVFTGSALATHTHTLTPAGTNSAPTLTMNSFTPAGTVSAPTFTGTLATIATEPAYYSLCYIQKS